jgi:hypothetical protein
MAGVAAEVSVEVRERGTLAGDGGCGCIVSCTAISVLESVVASLFEKVESEVSSFGLSGDGEEEARDPLFPVWRRLRSFFSSFWISSLVFLIFVDGEAGSESGFFVNGDLGIASCGAWLPVVEVQGGSEGGSGPPTNPAGVVNAPFSGSGKRAQLGCKYAGIISDAKRSSG